MSRHLDPLLPPSNHSRRVPAGETKSVRAFHPPLPLWINASLFVSIFSKLRKLRASRCMASHCTDLIDGHKNWRESVFGLGARALDCQTVATLRARVSPLFLTKAWQREFKSTPCTGPCAKHVTHRELGNVVEPARARVLPFNAFKRNRCRKNELQGLYTTHICSVKTVLAVGYLHLNFLLADAPH